MTEAKPQGVLIAQLLVAPNVVEVLIGQTGVVRLKLLVPVPVGAG